MTKMRERGAILLAEGRPTTERGFAAAGLPVLLPGHPLLQPLIIAQTFLHPSSSRAWEVRVRVRVRWQSLTASQLGMRWSSH